MSVIPVCSSLIKASGDSGTPFETVPPNPEKEAIRIQDLEKTVASLSKFRPEATKQRPPLPEPYPRSS